MRKTRLVGWTGVPLLALGLWSGQLSRAAAGTFDVFGPETFVRATGKPTTVTRDFAVAQPAAASYVLHLDNGGARGELGRVSSASVKLNGTVIFKPGDFGQNVATLEKPVTLTAANKLSVELSSAPGSGFSLRISGADNAPPFISAAAAPPPNEASWNRTDVVVTFSCSDALSGIATCPGPVTVASEGASQEVSGTAVDKAGNSATATIIIRLDKTPPTLAVTSVSDGSTVFESQLTLSGTAADALAGLAGVTCDGAAATIAAGTFACDLTLALGANAFSVQAADAAGNATAPLSLALTFAEPPSLEPPEVHIASPARGLVTRDDSVNVTGTINRSVITVSVNGVAAALAGTTFAAEVALEEGTNRLVATAATAMNEAAADSISVRRDTAPPLVVIETPRDGDRLVSPAVTVSGTVNDIIPGATVNGDDVTLTVNGTPAAVNNRTFMVPDLPLAVGDNTISAEAVDRAGNRRGASIHVRREPDLAGIRVEIVDGNNQRGPIHASLLQPLVVRLTGPQGEPLANRPVEFAVSKGDGLLDDPVRHLRRFALLTDDDGRAAVTYTLGSRTGEGFHRVRATTPGSLTFADFCATAEPGTAARIATAFMPLRRGVVDQPAPAPLAVIVTDASGNAIAGLPVTFSVEVGGGSFGGAGTTQVSTNADGIAETVFTLGPNPGREVNRVTATFPGNPGLPAAFVLSGFAPGPPEETRISGMVQNTAGKPIAGVDVEIEDVGLETQTGADGSFSIAVPPGGHHVAVDGRTANDPAHGIFYPYIEFPVEAVSGNDNPLDQVVVLPFLDLAGAKLVGGDEDVVLGMEGVPGFSIKVFAHSTILPDGTRAPLMMSSSQVKFDKMPMPPPQGSTPLVVGTFQPGGIRFDPPAQVTYPNINGLRPGDVADIFAFHHDIGQYVNVGPGTVSEDGTVIVSDPGFGFVQSGWHGLIRFPGPGGQAANGCSATLEWQHLGAGAGAAASGGPIVLSPRDDDRKNARVKVTFSPGGGSFDSSTWSGGPPVASRSGDSAAGVTAETMVQATGPTGTSSITSPIYRIHVEGQEDQTCQAEIEVDAVTVDIDVNLTPDEKDDITVSNRSLSGPVFIQPVMVRVTRHGGSGPVRLSVMPAARGTLDRTMLNLADGASDTVTFTPGTASAAVNDASILAQVSGAQVGKEDLTVVRVVLPRNVRRTNTPTAMRDRIPPRVDTSLRVTVSPNLGATGQVVTLTVSGQNATNGTVTLDGMAMIDLTMAKDVKLRGGTQTAASGAPGGANAGNLRLVARVRGQDTAQSPGFSVAAIPENFADAFSGPVTGPVRGIVVRDSWVSDSGVVADLDAAAIAEAIQVSTETGAFVGLGGGMNSGYLGATMFTTDTHSTPVARITGPGTQRIFQTSKFLDRRTGALDIPMTNSGLIIDRIAFLDAGVLKITTSKFGAAVTANGIASAAAQPVAPPISLTQVR